MAEPQPPLKPLHPESSLSPAKLEVFGKVAIHCRQGIGRAALLSSCLLVAAGMEPAAGFERIRGARGCEVPETAEQRDWVFRFAHHLAQASRK